LSKGGGERKEKGARISPDKRKGRFLDDVGCKGRGWDMEQVSTAGRGELLLHPEGGCWTERELAAKRGGAHCFSQSPLTEKRESLEVS